MRILLIEDDRKIAEALLKSLRADAHIVDHARTGEDGEELAFVNQYDVILLDIMLPRQDGWQTCRNIRAQGVATPVLMLTALGEVEDRVKGLNLGADDYLTKPFHTAELEARMRALVRRPSSSRSAVLEQFGLHIDLERRYAERDGRELSLTTREFRMLELFLLNPGRVLSRETISDHLWDMNYEPRSNVLEAFIKSLRQKVDRGFARPLIHTVRGLGYVFKEETA
ncbi:MAG: response regulator transcription factor [bacterium]|nr:response regulator transcription factor [bacterium]